MNDQDTIKRLEHKIEILEESILILKDTFKQEDWRPHPNLKLSKRQTELCSLLLKRRTASTEQIFMYVWGLDDLNDVSQSVREMISTIRAKLKLHDIKIDTLRAYGYSLSTENAEKLRGMSDKDEVPYLGPKKVPRNQKNNDYSNHSGIRGVYLHKPTSKWMVQLTVKGKQKYFGLYENKEEARFARRKAERQIYGSQN